MAVIAITPSRIWYGSAATLAYIAERLAASKRFPTYQGSFLEIEEGWQALDLTSMNPTELAGVRSIVDDIVSEVRTNGPAKHGGEKYYSGFLATLAELKTMLD